MRTYDKVLFGVLAAASVLYPLLALMQGESLYQTVSNAVVSVIFWGLFATQAVRVRRLTK